MARISTDDYSRLDGADWSPTNAGRTAVASGEKRT